MDKQLTEVVDEKTGEVVSADMATLVFGTTDAGGVIIRATAIADRLKDIIEKAHLTKVIQQKTFVLVDGWTAMGAMLGVFPVLDYCRRIERENERAYESRIVLRHISGAVVGAGEAICSSSERTWSSRDEYAIKSMAQTRATGKAYRLSFSWIMAMAGYQPTNAEEIPDDNPKVQMPRAKKEKIEPAEVVEDAVGIEGAPQEPEVAWPSEAPSFAKPAHSKFFTKLHAIAREKGLSSEKMKASIKVLYNKTSSKDLTDEECANLIQQIDKGAVRNA